MHVLAKCFSFLWKDQYVFFLSYLDIGKKDMHARNPADADPCVAKWKTLADLNQYKTFCLVACLFVHEWSL